MSKRTRIVTFFMLLLLFPLPSYARIEVYFNSQQCLDDILIKGFRDAEKAAREDKPASIDILIFSFTSQRLGDELLRIARDNPGVRIRILADLSQLERGEFHISPDIEDIISGKRERYIPVAERQSSYLADEEDKKAKFKRALNWLGARYRQRPIPNIEMRYKWYPAFSWDEEKKAPGYDHFHEKASILHHKAALINNETLLVGSYNWSESAEIKNLENLMLFCREGEERIVFRFRKEFEALWDKEGKPGPECRRLRDKIYQKIIKKRGE